MKGVLWSCMVILATYVIISGASTTSQKPHIVFIVADDLGFDDVSFRGSRQIPTPNLDALAYSGVILNSHYAQSVCTPTRTALLTGRLPIHLGTQWGVFVGPQPCGLGLNETLLPQYLKRLGYATHAIGKWHVGYYAKEYTPTFRGFDSHLGYWMGAGDYWDHTKRQTYNETNYVGVDFHDGMETVRNESGHYSTELFTERAQQIIQEHNTSQPMFLYLAHQAVHSSDGDGPPMEAPQRYIDKFSYIKNKQRRIYAAMVSALDESVGNVTRSLQMKGMLQNSILIFMSDNGGLGNGIFGSWGCNWPLRGMKHTMWEGGTRVAAFIWSPLLDNPGHVSDQLMHVTDWLPTLVSAAGGNVSALPSALDGVDMWHSLKNPHTKSARTEMLYNILPENAIFGIRVDKYKLVTETDSRSWYPVPGVLENKAYLNYEQGVHIMHQNGYENEDNVMTSSDIRTNTLVMNQAESAPDNMFETDLYAIFRGLGLNSKRGEPVVVNCGPKPANASTNCPIHAQCLFDLSTDPCEYNNIADWHPDIVKQLQMKLEAYRKTAVPSLYKDIDPKGLPIYHHNAWEVWVEL